MTNQITIFQPHAGVATSMDLPCADSLASLKRWEERDSDYGQRESRIDMHEGNTRNRDSIQGGSP